MLGEDLHRHQKSQTQTNRARTTAGSALAAGAWVHTEKLVHDNVQQSPAVPGKLHQYQHPGGST